MRSPGLYGALESIQEYFQTSTPSVQATLDTPDDSFSSFQSHPIPKHPSPLSTECSSLKTSKSHDNMDPAFVPSEIAIRHIITHKLTLTLELGPSIQSLGKPIRNLIITLVGIYCERKRPGV
ncbi:hypothetical protein EYC84_012091 [Monilinia fructicola]|uniref:Uncharacterized protein n=1 Tax=Monilinia fructicola TaxID=38448 RepID=A0A5M9J895_MONFR|nr:hypothetical protein EYC84_012091 [Monilinia fructicola]